MPDSRTLANFSLQLVGRAALSAILAAVSTSSSLVYLSRSVRGTSGGHPHRWLASRWQVTCEQLEQTIWDRYVKTWQCEHWYCSSGRSWSIRCSCRGVGPACVLARASSSRSTISLKLAVNLKDKDEIVSDFASRRFEGVSLWTHQRAVSMVGEF